MKKLSLLLITALVLSMALTGCGSKEENKQPTLDVDANMQANAEVNEKETGTIEQNIKQPESSTSDEVGWAHITIDVETNRPADFRDYNFYVNIVNKETWEWNLVDIYYDNGYKARATLPYGSYYITFLMYGKKK